MEINRKNKLLIGLVAFALLLLGKLFYIQIINDEYKKDASNNSMVYADIYPPRGVIFDRNGEILVGNSVCYDILVTPRDVSEFDTLALAEALDTTADFLRERMAYYRKYRSRIGYRTVPLLKQVPPEIYMKFAEKQYLFPGFRSQMRSIRAYPFNAGGNLLGYISEVNADDISRDPEYEAGDYIGRTGLESAMEKELRGEKGYHILLRDSRNRLQSAYLDGREDKPAVPGNNIVSTIDAHLQQYGQQLMEGKVGSVVAIEPSTGEILAMVSSPGIDVDVLARIGSCYDSLSRDPRKPMFNRTVMASYPPGSVFKLINGLIGLQEGVLKPSDRYPCNSGYYYSRTRKLGCHAHSSPLDFESAIATSCNGYFCYVLKNILENGRYSSTEEAFDAWREYVLSFGFGEKLESGIPAELGGNIPTSGYYDKLYGRGRWRFQTVVVHPPPRKGFGERQHRPEIQGKALHPRGYRLLRHRCRGHVQGRQRRRFGRRHSLRGGGARTGRLREDRHRTEPARRGQFRVHLLRAEGRPEDSRGRIRRERRIRSHLGASCRLADAREIPQRGDMPAAEIS